MEERRYHAKREDSSWMMRCDLLSEPATGSRACHFTGVGSGRRRKTYLLRLTPESAPRTAPAHPIIKLIYTTQLYLGFEVWKVDIVDM